MLTAQLFCPFELPVQDCNPVFRLSPNRHILEPHTFVRSSLAQLIDFPVVEGTTPRSEHAQGGLDALLAMLRAKTATDLLAATSRLQTVIGAAPLGNGDDESDVPHPSPSSQSGVANCEPQDPPRCGDLKWPLQLLPHRATSASLAAAIIESGGPVVEDLTPSALGIQVQLLRSHTYAYVCHSCPTSLIWTFLRLSFPRHRLQISLPPIPHQPNWLSMVDLLLLPLQPESQDIASRAASQASA